MPPDRIDLYQYLNAYINGGVMVASCVAGLFFLRFWRKTHDRLFAFFAASFFVLGINRLGLSLTDPNYEARYIFYTVRLIAFLLILFAIIDKNRAGRRLG